MLNIGPNTSVEAWTIWEWGVPSRNEVEGSSDISEYGSLAAENSEAKPIAASSCGRTRGTSTAIVRGLGGSGTEERDSLSDG